MIKSLSAYKKLFVKQSFELAEVFNFETRNKYRILDESGRDVAFAAEQQKGVFSFILRQFLGHWRSFEFHFFTPTREKFLVAKHPFRFYFTRLDVYDIEGNYLGGMERRFSIFSKKFQVQIADTDSAIEVSSPFWRIWTFPFKRRGQKIAEISKKWTGLGFEMFTDKDTFLVEYSSENLNENERAVILAAALYVDLMFFEKKAD